MKFSFNVEDASQVFVGAFALAVPISFSEEAWRLGEILPYTNLLMLFVLSVLFLSLFTYESVFQKNIRSRIFHISMLSFLMDAFWMMATLARHPASC